MASSPKHPSEQQNIGAALQRMTDSLTGLVHDEIELAKAEISAKVTKLLKATVIAVVAGVFFIFGLFILLEGASWLTYYAIPFPKGTVFFGFFVVALLTFIVGGVAGFFAARAFKAGAPPTPNEAIAEAKATKEAVSAVWKKDENDIDFAAKQKISEDEDTASVESVDENPNSSEFDHVSDASSEDTEEATDHPGKELT